MTRPSVMFETTKFFNHPLYDNSIPSIVQPHDIGLLKFGRSLKFNGNYTEELGLTRGARILTKCHVLRGAIFERH